MKRGSRQLTSKFKQEQDSRIKEKGEARKMPKRAIGRIELAHLVADIAEGPIADRVDGSNTVTVG